MIRTLLTTTAVAALLATGAIAQEAAPSTQAPAGQSDLLMKGYQIVDTDGLATRLIGFPVYTSAAVDAERIGEINDLVINQSGDVAAVIVGVGGFLGIGEKNVAVDYAQLKWTMGADNTERLVLETTKEALNAAPAVELREDEPDQTAATTQTLPADTAAGSNDAVETGAISTQPGATPPATGIPPLDRGALTELDEMTLTAEELIGTSVYGPNDEHIGVIGDLVLADDGKAIDALIVDVGGFLGIGAKEVAIGFESLDFAVGANNDRFLLISATKDQLEAQAAFNRDTYKNERDSQRLVIKAS